MISNWINILRAKFGRESKNLLNTILVGGETNYILESSDGLSVLRDCLNIADLKDNEIPIIFHFDNEYNWYILTNSRIINRKKNEIFIINKEMIVKIYNPTDFADFSMESKLNLNHIDLQMKSNEMFRLEIEQGSFSTMYNIVQFWRSKDSPTS